MRSSYLITKSRWHTAFRLCASWAHSFTLATSVGLLLAPIEAGGDEFPMNFCRRVTKTRIIHRSAWNRDSANFAFWGFCELRIDGVLGSSRVGGSQREVRPYSVCRCS